MLALRSFAKRSVLILNILCILALLAGCSGSQTPAPGGTSVSPAAQTQSASQPQSQGLQKAEVTFIVKLPAKLGDEQHLFIEFLDEVSGLAINPARAQMETHDGQTFAIKIPWTVGSLLKYRYFRDNDPTGYEYTSLNQQVRYRQYYVDGPGEVNDIVTTWKTTEAITSGLGRIQGQVANKANNAPIVNALVTAGGVQTLTSSDGSFLLEGLPPGTHNLVISSLDGSFRPFQQGAVVASDSTTPALALLTPANLVNVTFIVQPPAEHTKDAPIRVVGNIYSLGNTFADLSGGMSVIASRASVMSILPDGHYSLTLKLPAGLDLHYKYSLGDGFWNAERAGDGSIHVRQLIVPGQDITVQDTVDTWKSGDLAPITFTVKVPDSTPVSDTISVQFNPYGWTSPIPMWPVGNNTWSYTLYSPLNSFTTASYRYCRNDQCGEADAVETSGANAQGKTFSPSSTAQTFTDTVSAWAWSDAGSEPVVVPGSDIKARDANFQAGAEFMTGYKPSWQPYMNWAFQNLKDLGANSVMLTPTWHLTHKTPPVIEAVPGQDPLWFDLAQMVNQSQQRGLNVVIHPVLRYSEDPQTWWQTAARDEGWWQSWFDRYRTFLMYNADLAAQSGAKMLVIGDESLIPALPGGTLSDGKPSGVPGDAESRWSKLIADVRARYPGKIAWLVSYAGQMPPTPEFIKDVDLLYVQLSAPLIKSDQPSQEELEASITTILDSDVLKLQEKTNHPVILGLQYASVRGMFDGCVESDGKCLPLDAFKQPAPAYPATELSLKEQAAVYSAVLSAVNGRSWITGFYSAGYNPSVELRDLSVSTRSKPASDVLWYWYPRLLGQVNP